MIGTSEMALDYRTRKFTVKEYYAMVGAGILQERERVELIEGDILEMAPIGPRHGGRHIRLSKLLIMRFAESAFVSTQGSIIVSEFSAPEPDFAILRGREDFYERDLPRPNDVLGVIELSDSSLSFDRRKKAQLYGRAGIRDYWIVNLREDRLEVHRQPNELGYAKTKVLMPDETVALEALPDVEFTVSEFLART
ncbi:MAG TPA: Uma2 family endonuclease [Candidatus Binatia bacterium]|nr:Uma2 family endonuclease [Candidatus Binatia bacterium]